MQAGSLRHRVALQTVTETRDAVGGVVESWATTATVWAAVEPLRGREFYQARAEQAGVDTRIRIRYRSGITPKMRISWGSHVYDIEAVIEPDSRRRELHLMCSEVL